jgi:hypothetical protein
MSIDQDYKFFRARECINEIGRGERKWSKETKFASAQVRKRGVTRIDSRDEEKGNKPHLAITYPTLPDYAYINLHLGFRSLIA